MKWKYSESTSHYVNWHGVVRIIDNIYNPNHAIYSREEIYNISSLL